MLLLRRGQLRSSGGNLVCQTADPCNSVSFLGQWAGNLRISGSARPFALCAAQSAHRLYADFPQQTRSDRCVKNS
jgi:hypothetical protein